MQGIMTFESVEQAAREGFSFFERKANGEILVRKVVSYNQKLALAFAIVIPRTPDEKAS